MLKRFVILDPVNPHSTLEALINTDEVGYAYEEKRIATLPGPWMFVSFTRSDDSLHVRGILDDLIEQPPAKEKPFRTCTNTLLPPNKDPGASP